MTNQHYTVHVCADICREEDEEEKYKWWEEHGGDGSTKWSTLIHNGVLFPPAYIPLPKGVKMKYDGTSRWSTASPLLPRLIVFGTVELMTAGQSLTLPPESEEVAGFWAAKLETDHARDATFQANFFRDFKAVLKDFPPVCACLLRLAVVPIAVM